MKSYSSTTNLMLQAAEKSYNVLQRDFREIEFLQSSKKGPADFANKTLTKVQSIVINSLLNDPKLQSYFDLEGNFLHGVEEGAGFFVGIDGYSNFERSIPYFSLVIAAVNGQGKLDSAIIFCPGLLEYYIAEKGKGAWKEPIGGFGNGSMRLKVSERNIGDSILVSGGGIEKKSSINMLNFNAESISIAYIASGKMDYHYLAEKPFFKLLAELFISEAAGKLVRNSEQVIIFNKNLPDPV